MIKQQCVLVLGRFWGSAHAVLLMATLIWAGHAVALRMSVGEISPVLLMQLRWLGAFLILVVIYRKTLPRYVPLALQNWRWVFAMGGGGLASLYGFFGNADLVRNHVSLSYYGVAYGAWWGFLSATWQGKNLRKSVISRSYQ